MNILDLQQTIQSQQQHYYPSNNCCRQNTNVYFLCSNYQCKKPPIMCKNLKCPCHQIHKKCLKTQKQSLINALEDKLVSYKQVKQIIQDEIYKLIQKLQQIQTYLFSCINKKRLQQIGLDQRDKILLDYLKSGQFNQISSYKIYQTMANLIRPQKINKITKYMEQDIKKYCSALDQTVNQFTQFSKLKIQSFNQIYFGGSSIIKNQLQQQILQNFFQGQSKKIKKIDLIFQASLNQFSAKKFHQLCDQIPQTITLCRSQNGQIFGGYSKVQWRYTNNNNWNKNGFCIEDSSGQSFLFSITNNKKFNLQQKYSSILYRQQYGPSYGSDIGYNYYDTRKCDLKISDECNKNRNSYFCPYKSYKISNENQNQSNYILNDILISQYEVWQVEFQK